MRPLPWLACPPFFDATITHILSRITQKLLTRFSWNFEKLLQTIWRSRIYNKHNNDKIVIFCGPIPLKKRVILVLSNMTRSRQRILQWCKQDIHTIFIITLNAQTWLSWTWRNNFLNPYRCWIVVIVVFAGIPILVAIVVVVELLSCFVVFLVSFNRDHGCVVES